jgi:thiosulfate/3-mercaptopyruvate sulfurtransferase
MRGLLAVLLVASAAGGQTPNTSMLVSADWLARRLSDPAIVVLHVTRDSSDYDRGHIPGARFLAYDAVRIERDGIGTELRSLDDLRKTFEALGVSDGSHVVIYAGWRGQAPVAARVFLSLDHLGLQRISLLDGGLEAWRREGRPVVTEVPRVAAGAITPRPRAVTVDADFVMRNAGKPGFALIDTRTTPEFLGTSTSARLPSEGRIAGAKQLEWQQLFTDAETGTFLSMPELRKLYAERVAAGDTVITYCLVGYRASMTYFGARLLGYPVRLYDGSYQEWARLRRPMEKGATP